MRTQGSPLVTKEILSDLSLPRLSQIGVIAVGAAAGFIQLDDCDRVVVRGLLAVEAADHVAVESF